MHNLGRTSDIRRGMIYMYKLFIKTCGMKEGHDNCWELFSDINEDCQKLKDIAKAFFEDKENVCNIRRVFDPDSVTVEIFRLNDTTGAWDTIFLSREYV